MKVKSAGFSLSRRDFTKKLSFAAALIGLQHHRLLALVNPFPKTGEPEFAYQFRTMSVSHLAELQNDLEQLKQSGRLSDNETFRSYLANMKYALPEDFPEAKSLIVIAVFTPMAYVKFHYASQTYDIMIPPQYFDDGVTTKMVEEAIRKQIIGSPDYRLQRSRGLMLKRLAVRSGLGQYGRNNICYVDGMGSFTTLLAYFTDYNFLEDHFQDVSLMRRCLKCNICRRKCPTQCIPDKDFIIDAGRCVTLYNEIEGEFPEWLPANAHNALMGCMRCQFDCPQNRDVITKSVRLQDVTEEETHKILAGTTEPELLATLSEKLQYYYPATDPKYFPIFTRNLGVLIQ